jgi:hypothetical protein
MPVRITRPLRYSLYRASDSQWYFGERDWSGASGRFNTIQPIAGPFLPAASGGLAFAYFDSAGAVLPTPVPDTRAIALVRVQMIGQTRSVTRALGAASKSASPRADTVVVYVAPRNR